MDGNSSLERRYSFNMAQGNPVAESTHLNGSSFSWGSSLSPKHRSNSTTCLNNTHSPSAFNNKSIVSPKSKNITKIDARIAADVQSKGLASRIVKYHESGTRLNRSMSAHNLYSKPGQFPAVTLKKTDLPYRATKQELSMIRIPPPEKSSFYGNTISSLLRSNSVVGLQSKRNDDLSRENRPIIHPPPTENDMAPTRSVLDVLKEISRKRINSDDLEAEETSKKYCNRTSNDLVDTGNNTTSAIPQHFVASSISCQRYKRQRDCITPHQSVQLSETKTSPEQAKKRVCNYNNDITSSLSSSIKCKPNGSTKRLSAKYNLNQTMPTNLEAYETQKTKMQRYHDYHINKTNTGADVRFENLESTLRNEVRTTKPITPIPPTPCVQDQSNIVGVPPKRTVSEPVCNQDRPITMNSTQPSNKPRLTLFNKNYDDDQGTRTGELSASAGENTDDLDDFGDCAGIPFVKPKKLSSISGLRNPVIERTQKSKLALMLSGLRGELYQNFEADELDSSKAKADKTVDNKINNNTSAVISALKSTSTITTLTTVTSSSNVGIPNTTSSLNFSTTTKTTSSSMPPSTVSTNNTPSPLVGLKTSSPLVGLKVSQQKPSPANVSSTLSVDSTKSTETNSKPSVPVLGGFSFGTTNTSSGLVVNATTYNNINKDITSSNSLTSRNALNIGQTTQLTSTSSSITDSNTNKLPANTQTSAKDNAFPAFSNPHTILSNNTSTSLNAPNSLAATNTFTFGTNVTAPTSKISTPSAVVGASSFNFTVPTTSSQITTASAAPIMFGSLTSSTTSINTTMTSAVATTTTSTLKFGAVATSTNLGGLTNTSSFTFNTPKQPSASEPSPNSLSGGVAGASFNFGSSLNAAPVPTFGTNANAAIKPLPTNTAFSFGSDTKIPNSSSGDQNNPTVAKHAESNVFNTKPPPLFGSPSFNTASTSGSTPMFGNAANSSEKNVFNSSNTTSIFGSSSAKVASQTFGSASDNKPATLGTPSVFGGSNANSSTPTPFSFGSKPEIAQTTVTNNASATPGGFSFSSTVSNSSEGGTFGFGGKTSTNNTNTSNNTFGVPATSSIQNKNFTFGGSATNKPDNQASVFGGVVSKPTENTASPGGFSFGSAVASKSSTFSFGTGSNSFSGSNVSTTNNSTTGFAFGGATASKPVEVSTNKAFSFGSLQQQQQIMTAPNNNSNTSNIFGSSAASQIAPPPAFNFNSGGSTNLQSNTPATNNLFAPPPSTITTGPGDRPIRRATRRLQK